MVRLPILILLSILLNGCTEKTDKAGSQTHILESKTIRQTVEAAGKVVSHEDVEIKCKASGLIVSLPFEPGDSVKQGDLLLKLDPVDEQRRVDSAHARLRLAQIQMDQAKISHESAREDLKLKTREYQKALEAAQSRYEELSRTQQRTLNLHSQNLASENEREAAVATAMQAESSLVQAESRLASLKILKLDLKSKELEIKSRQQNVEQAQLELEIARQALADTRVLAPMDGIISALHVKEGQIISSGISNVGGGTSIMVLSDFTELVIRTQVDESSISRLQPNQSAEFTVDAWPFRRFQGHVKSVAPRGEVSQNVVFFTVDVSIEPEGMEALRPEMSANVQIESATVDNAVCLPWNALRQKENQPAVQIKDEGLKKIQIGISDHSCIEVTQGLQEGDSIIISNLNSSQWKKGSKPKARVRF